MSLTLDEYIQQMSSSIHLQCRENDVSQAAEKAAAPSVLLPVYYVLPAYGEGFCRICRVSHYASILVLDVCYFDELRIRMPDSSFFYISYYFSLSAGLKMDAGTFLQLVPNTLYTNARHEDCYETVFYAGKPIRGLIVLLSPKGLRQNLLTRFAADTEADADNILDRLRRVDGLPLLPELKAIFHQICQFNGTGITAQLFIESKFNEMIILFQACCMQNDQKTQSPSAPRVKHRIKEEDIRQIDIVKAYIADHLSDPPKMAVLARLACMSQAKLKYCFQEVTGQSVTRWQQNLRMQTARELLLTTELPIREIAFRVGYQNASSFSSAFSKTEGISAAQFRSRETRM